MVVSWCGVRNARIPPMRTVDEEILHRLEPLETHRIYGWCNLFFGKMVWELLRQVLGLGLGLSV